MSAPLHAYFSLKYHRDEIILCMDTGAISMKIIINEDFWRAQFHSSWSTLPTFEKTSLAKILLYRCRLYIKSNFNSLIKEQK